MRKVAVWLVVLMVGSAAASAQQAAPKLSKSFDVASIKQSAPLDPQKMLSGQQRVGMKTDAGRVDIENWSILELLNAAYKVSPTRLTGPGWGGFSPFTATRFDIHATIPAGATQDDVPEMLQSLLAERWKLAFHNEQREQQALALVVGKDGPKLQRSPPEAPADAANNTNRPDPIQVSGDPAKGGMTIRGAGQAGAMKLSVTPDGMVHMTAERLTMAQLADSLTQFAGQPVVDQTGLTGNYQVAFELSQADVLAAARSAGLQIPGASAAAGAGPAAAAADPPGQTGAYQSVEKMGLKLESRKVSVEYMVIDRLEKLPTED
jgi:uncharacterized protein (TIGR03435 family)